MVIPPMWEQSLEASLPASSQLRQSPLQYSFSYAVDVSTIETALVIKRNGYKPSKTSSPWASPLKQSWNLWVPWHSSQAPKVNLLCFRNRRSSCLLFRYCRRVGSLFRLPSLQTLHRHRAPPPTSIFHRLIALRWRNRG